MVNAGAQGSQGWPGGFATHGWWIAFLCVYLLNAGHGFVQDDFRWIDESQVTGFADLAGLLGADNGFYRPVVLATFSFCRSVFDMSPFGYGLFNVILAVACACSVRLLLRATGLTQGVATAGGAIWLLNVHGLRWAVLWISGRTALLLCLFSSLSVTAALRGAPVWSGLLALLAMLSKEEATVLPGMTFVAVVLFRPPRRIASVVSSCAALVVYLALRMNTNAFGPTDAPLFYRFTFDLAVVSDNLLKLVERSGTVSALCVLGAFLLLGRRGWRWAGSHLAFGAMWFLGGAALTSFLPVRSELYACFPSIGASVAAAGLIAQAWARAAPWRQTRVLTAAAGGILLAIPIHHLRADRWVSIAEVSSNALRTISSLNINSVPAPFVVLMDRADERVSLKAAFGNELERAIRLKTGVDVRAQIVNRNASPPHCADCTTFILQLSEESPTFTRLK